MTRTDSILTGVAIGVPVVTMAVAIYFLLG